MGEIRWTESRFLRVPLTDDEVRERGEQLARAIDNLAVMKAEHDAAKKGMKSDEGEIEAEISKIAAVVKHRAEERSVKVELRFNSTLGLMELVRLDSGEVYETREPTQDDKLRAQQLAQDDMFKDPKSDQE